MPEPGDGRRREYGSVKGAANGKGVDEVGSSRVEQNITNMLPIPPTFNHVHSRISIKFDYSLLWGIYSRRGMLLPFCRMLLGWGVVGCMPGLGADSKAIIR